MSALNGRPIGVHIYAKGIDVEGNVSGRRRPERGGDHGGSADSLRVGKLAVGQEQ